MRQDRAHATRGADDQQALALVVLAFLDVQALEQQFPGGDGRQRQRRRVGETEGLGHVADNALIHHVQFAVATGPGDGTGVEHLVPGLEQRDLAAYRLDHAGHVPAQHLGNASFGLDVLADLGVHRVDRNGLDLHQQVPGTGDRLRQLDVLERLRVGDGQ